MSDSAMGAAHLGEISSFPLPTQLHDLYHGLPSLCAERLSTQFGIASRNGSTRIPNDRCPGTQANTPTLPGRALPYASGQRSSNRPPSGFSEMECQYISNRVRSRAIGILLVPNPRARKGQGLPEEISQV